MWRAIGGWDTIRPMQLPVTTKTKVRFVVGVVAVLWAALNGPWTFCLEADSRIRLELANAAGDCIDQFAAHERADALLGESIQLIQESCVVPCGPCNDLSVVQSYVSSRDAASAGHDVGGTQPVLASAAVLSIVHSQALLTRAQSPATATFLTSHKTIVLRI